MKLYLFNHYGSYSYDSEHEYEEFEAEDMAAAVDFLTKKFDPLWKGCSPEVANLFEIGAQTSMVATAKAIREREQSRIEQEKLSAAEAAERTEYERLKAKFG